MVGIFASYFMICSWGGAEVASLPGADRLQRRVPQRGRRGRGRIADLSVDAVAVRPVEEQPDTASQHHALIAGQIVGGPESRCDDERRPGVVFLRDAVDRSARCPLVGIARARHDRADRRRAAGPEQRPRDGILGLPGGGGARIHVVRAAGARTGAARSRGDHRSGKKFDACSRLSYCGV